MAMLHHGKLAELNRYLTEPIDVFVCSASFEERCLSVPESLRLAQDAQAIVAHIVHSDRRTDEHFARLWSQFQNQGVRASLNRHDPLSSADTLDRTLKDVQNPQPQRFLIDVTTFTREALLMLFRLLQFRVKESDHVSFIYAHALEYSLGAQPKTKWLSRGIREIRSVLGYPGDLLPALPVHLIVLVGFEYERAVGLIREYEPTFVSIGCAKEDEVGTEGHRDTHRESALRLMRTFGASTRFTFPCYDVEGAVIAIQAEVERVPDANTIIAPMNTKISTLGAAVVASQNERVQLCYAEPEIYNCEYYSEPDDDFYHFSVPAVLPFRGPSGPKA